jgi:multicomponent Na+:H+ antiporter subunit E
MKHAGSLFFVLISVWLMWSGHYTTLLVTLGVASVFFVLLTIRRMGAIDHESAPVEVGPRLVAYLPWLLWEIAKSNVDVAFRVLRREMPIRPHVIRVPAGQRTDIGRVIYANSITLTPGTVTMALADDGFTVHALTDEAAAGVLSGEMDRKVQAVEGRL